VIDPFSSTALTLRCSCPAAQPASSATTNRMKFTHTTGTARILLRTRFWSFNHVSLDELVRGKRNIGRNRCLNRGGGKADLLARSLHRSSDGAVVVVKVGGITVKIRDAATQLDLAGLYAGMCSQGRLVKRNNCDCFMD
jgi:hypothetical protein